VLRSLCLCALCALPALLPAAAASAAAKAGAAAAVRDIQRTYAAVTALQAEFIQKLTHRDSGSVETRSGTLLFRKPLSVRWETFSPHAELLLITEKEIWNYLPDEEVAYRYPPEATQDSRALIDVLTGRARLDRDFHVEEAGNEDALLRLRLYPLEPTRQMTELSLWIDHAGRFIRRARVLDFFGNINEVDFVKLRFDPEIGEKAFTFTPPEGTKVERP
jgi:outer membrane lipoprotein carrier protein